MTRQSRRRNSHQAGFTYLWVLIGVAITSAALAAGGEAFSRTMHRAKLAQLDWVGEQYRQAIGSYYEGSPGSVRRYPPSLEDLLLDKRYLTTRRHIRRIYENPLTQVNDWEILRAPDGGVMGVRASIDERNARVFGYVPLSPK